MAIHCPHALAPMVGFLDGLSLAQLEHLGDVYSPAVEFQDPLHQARGIAALRRVYENLFQQLANVAVAVTDAHGDERTGFLLWTMTYQLRGRQRIITGTSHLQFAADGRVMMERDFWDASGPVYGEVPLLGWVLRHIKRRVSRQ